MTPSHRESEVLALRKAGLSAPEIAQRLGISKGTVKVHVTNLRRKGLEVPRREPHNLKRSKIDSLQHALRAAHDTIETLTVLTHHQVTCLEEFKRVYGEFVGSCCDGSLVQASTMSLPAVGNKL